MKNINLGDQIFHKAFGYGIVEKIEGTWLTISFHGMVKRIYAMPSLFIPLENVERYTKSKVNSLKIKPSAIKPIIQPVKVESPKVVETTEEEIEESAPAQLATALS